MLHQLIYTKHIKSIVVILLTTMLFSCAKKIEEINRLYQENEDIPLSETKDFKLSYTLYGEKVLVLTAPLMLDYSNQKNFQYQYFPKKIRIELIDKNAKDKTIVTADKAYIYKNPDISELIGNVHIQGVDGSTLSTHHLYWDTKNKHIFGETETYLQQHGEEINGIGFDASIDFKNVRLNKISGQLKVNQTNNSN